MIAKDEPRISVRKVARYIQTIPHLLVYYMYGLKLINFEIIIVIEKRKRKIRKQSGNFSKCGNIVYIRTVGRNDYPARI